MRRPVKFVGKIAVRSSALAIVFAVGAFTSQLAAQPGDPLSPLFGNQQDASACFRREYDARHLAQHPKQIVTEMLLELRRARGPDPYVFYMAVKRRQDTRWLKTEGVCRVERGIVLCGVECDGGGVAVQRDGSEAIKVDLRRYGRIRMNASCEEGDHVELEPGADDHVFALHRAPPRACAQTR